MDKAERYLILAEQLLSILETTADEFKSLYLKLNRPLTIQEKVSIGLYKKMYFTFQSLIIDTKLESSSAMHHLKTLTETFIRLSWINKGKESEFILASSYEEKIKYFNTNQWDSKEWQNAFDELIKNNDGKYKKFCDKKIKGLADECGLTSIYNRIYRQSCEPSHLSDLIDYMPLTSTDISLAPPKTTMLWATIALQYGLFIILELLKGCSDHELLKENSPKYKKTLTSQIIVLEKGYDIIKAMAAV